MPIGTWSGLQKSATDDETIEQAIDRIVQAHNADPEAHGAEGEALDQHKSAEVIDHPAQSIVPDKLSGGDVVIQTDFSTLAPWTSSGDVSNSDFNGLDLYVERPGGPFTSKTSTAIYANGELFDDSGDIYFETRANWQGSSDSINAWWGFVQDETSTQDGFAFQVRSGTLYAHVRRNGVTYDVSLGSFVGGTSHLYQMKFVFAEQRVYFFIDKAEVVSVLLPTHTGYWDDDRGPYFGVTVPTTNDGNFYFQYVFAWKKILTP